MLRTVPVRRHRAAIQNPVVELGAGIIHALDRRAEADVGHLPSRLAFRGVAEGLAQTKHAGGSLAVAFLLHWITGHTDLGRIGRGNPRSPAQPVFADDDFYRLADRHPAAVRVST